MHALQSEGRVCTYDTRNNDETRTMALRRENEALRANVPALEERLAYVTSLLDPHTAEAVQTDSWSLSPISTSSSSFQGPIAPNRITSPPSFSEQVSPTEGYTPNIEYVMLETNDMQDGNADPFLSLESYSNAQPLHYGFSDTQLANLSQDSRAVDLLYAFANKSDEESSTMLAKLRLGVSWRAVADQHVIVQRLPT